MKKLLTALAACAAFSAQAETLNVAATPVPHAEILEVVKPLLAKEGVELKVRVFTDYVQPNLQVQQKNLDANFFQHQPYLDEFNASRKTELVSVAGVHVEPFGAYSSKIKDLSELPQGATVAIPNDATNGGRALLLLQKAGVITLKPEAGILATPKDIVQRLHAEIKEFMVQPEIKEHIFRMGLLPVDTPSVANLRIFVQTEIARWSSVVEQAGIAGSQ